MTFRIETVFDQHQACPTGYDHPDHPTDLDSRTWTCRTCQQSVYIEMADQAGNHYTVERVPAREMRVDDFIVYRETSGITARSVTASNRYPGKGNLWHLAAAGYGSAQISLEQYVSRIPL